MCGNRSWHTYTMHLALPLETGVTPMSKEKEEVDYYALKKIPALVMWYLPVVDRLRCLFSNPEDAKLMSCHTSDEHKNDGKLQHPANGKQCQDFNDNHQDFANELRNVRFA
jgi:hypothetical protein